MCGRYYIPKGNDEFADIDALLEMIGEACGDSPALEKMKTGEVFPADIVPVITQDAPALMKWGFEGYGGKGLIINARLETAAEKPTFRRSFATQRCLVPAGYYFERKRRG